MAGLKKLTASLKNGLVARGIKEKLITIFVIIKVLPLILLAWPPGIRSSILAPTWRSCRWRRWPQLRTK